jgi:hypothetical protein
MNKTSFFLRVSASPRESKPFNFTRRRGDAEGFGI